MNNKVTLNALAVLLSRKSGESQKVSENFLKEFFSLITSTLETGDNVKIKGFGTFKIISVSNRRSVDVNTGEGIEIPGHRKIVFVPSKELAEEVNAPFSAFESVELNPDVEDELEMSLPNVLDADSKEATSEKLFEENFPDAEQVAKDQLHESAASETYNIEEPVKSGNDSTSESDVENAGEDDEISLQEVSEITVAGDDEISDTDSCNQVNNEKSGNNRFWWGIITGVAVTLLLIGMGIGIYILVKKPSSTVVAAQENPESSTEKVRVDTISRHGAVLAMNDSVSVQMEKDYPDTQPSDKVTYDVITTTRYLTTVSQAHYGNFNFWPYIYEENKAILGHPDRIKPGTKVVIPPLSKYGVDPKNLKDIEKAKEKGREIYSRYK